MDEQRFTALKAFDTVNQRILPGDTFSPGDLTLRENGITFDDLRQRRFVGKADSASAEKAIERAEEDGRHPIVPGADETGTDLAGETVLDAERQRAEREAGRPKRP